MREFEAIDVIINFFMKNIPQANQIAGFESSTGQTKKSLAAGHQTIANFGGSVISAGTIHVHDLKW
jgi:hypothetical protein